MTGSVLLNTLLTATALALACAVLSVIVVLRRWAFIGEGISHSGFGGAGTAWLVMLAFPAVDLDWLPYASVVIFCLATAFAIGALSRERAAAVATSMLAVIDDLGEHEDAGPGGRAMVPSSRR